MDSTEAQLRFGSALSNTTDTTSPSHPLHVSNSRSTRERLTREEPRILQVVDTRRRARFGTVGKFVDYFCSILDKDCLDLHKWHIQIIQIEGHSTDNFIVISKHGIQ